SSPRPTESCYDGAVQDWAVQDGAVQAATAMDAPSGPCGGYSGTGKIDSAISPRTTSAMVRRGAARSLDRTRLQCRSPTNSRRYLLRCRAGGTDCRLRRLEQT